MASPQLENGFTRIANELLEVIAAARLTATQYSIIMLIWRYSYGYNRKNCGLSISFIENATGLSSRGIRNEINTLIKHNIIVVLRKQSCNTSREFAFQKDYSKWKIKVHKNCNTAEEPQCCSQEEVQFQSAEEPQYRSAEEVQHPSTEESQFPQERKVKESSNTYMCKRDLNEPFNRFWEAYPRRQAKQDAFKAFRKLSPDESLLTSILEAVKHQTASDNWQKNNGQYIPLPATYLNGKRWLDEEPRSAEAEPMTPILNRYGGENP